jgi:hypothetical protein
MNDDRKDGQVPLAAGQCATCRHAVVVTSDRRSQFVRCLRAETDAGFAKYPVLPMRACPGFDGTGASRG